MTGKERDIKTLEGHIKKDRWKRSEKQRVNNLRKRLNYLKRCEEITKEEFLSNVEKYVNISVEIDDYKYYPNKYTSEGVENRRGRCVYLLLRRYIYFSEGFSDLVRAYAKENYNPDLILGLGGDYC